MSASTHQEYKEAGKLKGDQEMSIPVAPEESQESQPLCVSRHKAARILGISERMLWSMTQTKQISHVRAGRRVLYPISALREWVGRNTIGEGSLK